MKYRFYLNNIPKFRYNFIAAQCTSITKIKWLLMVTEIITVKYCPNHKTDKIQYGQTAKFLNVHRVITVH
jgi:hypothetical protein